MRSTAVVLAWITALGLLVLTLPRSTAATARPATARRVDPVRPVTAAAAQPSRDLFHFVEQRAAAAPVVTAPPRPVEQAVTPQPAPTPEPIRVLGIVRQGNGLRALLGFHGETSLVGVGGRFAGYEVIGLDEEKVRLRSLAGGAELSVELPLD